MYKNKGRRVGLFMPEKLYEAIEKFAKATDCRASDVIREATEELIRKYGEKYGVTYERY